MLRYYLGYNGRRVNVLLSREEALNLLFTTRGSVKGLCVMVYDEKDKLVRIIPNPKRDKPK
ncbi:hypothetical protein ACF3MZ_26300 [Paenibacillaceae bacterium WGS1546]|uniref:hypothetical protein n=1 Tax=Cohnella sp. WGS1546 TaxID=3366810 RepID=UPI00372CFB08